jgi:hypothetical protein
MRAQVRLLEHLVQMWDPDQHVFHVGMHTLTIDIEDIYFQACVKICAARRWT